MKTRELTAAPGVRREKLTDEMLDSAVAKRCKRMLLPRCPRILLVAVLILGAAGVFLAYAQPPSPGSGPASASSRPLLQYTLPPDKLAKAYALYLLEGYLYFITALWGFLVLWLMVRFHFGPRLRRWAERASYRRVVQAVVVMSLFVVVPLASRATADKTRFSHGTTMTPPP